MNLRTCCRFLTAIAFAALTIPSPAGTAARPKRRPVASPPSQAAGVSLSRDYGKLPLAFEPNQGQTDARVRFLARGGGMTAFFTDTETAMVLSRSRQAKTPDRLRRPEAPAGEIEQTVVRMKLEKASQPRRAVGLEKLPGISNYFIGNDPAQWHTNVPQYARIQYEGVYPGIDLVWYGNQRRLEYDFVVAPGADAKQIQVAYEGVESLVVEANGDLVLRTALGEMRQQKPRVYQEIGGKRVEVAAQYAITARYRVSFALARYDRKRELRIDPVVLVYSTYLGGSGEDWGYGIAVDAAGSAYVTGFTVSTNFPTQSPYQATLQGSSDAFVTKLTPTGNALAYSTYLGGSGYDYGQAIAVDGAGSAYVTGYTTSTNFPTQSPYQGTLKGNTNAFVTKLTPAGNALAYSTYLGGSGYDYGQAIAVDGAGSAYVTGYTSSTNFPTQSPFQATYHAGAIYNAFVTKLTPQGNALVYSTYLGGSDDDTGHGIAVDAAGSAYVTGSTLSTNFPTQSPYQATYGGSQDAFVTKLTPAGNALVYSTYLGGNSQDWGYGIAVDAAGSAYVTGSTVSTNFFTQSPYQATYGGGQDAFVTKLTPAGNALVYSTYLGGSGYDNGLGIAVDAAGSAYVTGYTYSTNFPTQSPYQATNHGGSNAFVTKLTPAGNALGYSTYLGGSGGDYGYGIAVDAAGSAYVTGYTTSTNFPTQSPYQATNQGNGDAFVAKLSLPSPAVTADSVAPSSGSGSTPSFTAVYSDGNGYTDLTWTRLLVNSTMSSVGACDVGYNRSTNLFYLMNDAGNAWLGPVAPNSSGTAQNSQCVLNGSGSSAVGSSNSLAVTASLSFDPSFAGAKTIYMYAAGSTGLTSGWVSRGTWTAVGTVEVTADSVTPSSGGGSTPSFTAVYSDGNGYTDLTWTRLLLNSIMNSAGACDVGYLRTTNMFYLVNDAGNAWLGPIAANSSGTLQNSQCVLSGSGSSAVGLGNSLTVTASLSFNPAFAGGKTIYLYAAGSTGLSSGWVSRGTWTALGTLEVTANSVTPSSGSGSTPSFTAVYSDGNGYTDLTWTRILVNSTMSSVGACDVGYNRSTNLFYLVNDAGTAWLGPVTPNPSGTVQNTQCVLSGFGSSAVGSGNSLTVTASLSFNPSFAGAKTIYLYAAGSTGLSSGWVSRGTWTAVGTLEVTADSVAPSSGWGSTTSFTAVYSDGYGYADLTWTRILLNSTMSSVGACDVGYDRSTNLFYLVNDAGTAWLGPVAPNSSGTAQNSQCVLNGSRSSVVGSSNSLTVTASLSFNFSFAGAKTIYLYAAGSTGLSSGWVSRGTWTAVGTVAVTADSVVPSSGSGTTPSFVAVYSDGNGYADLTWTRILLNSTMSSVGACDVGYDRSTNLFYLVNDAGNAWLGPVTPNSSGTAQNSQCVLNGSGSSAVGLGDSLTVTASLNFNPSFAGAKTIYMYAAGSTGLSSGWVSRGTWTVP